MLKSKDALLDLKEPIDVLLRKKFQAPLVYLLYFSSEIMLKRVRDISFRCSFNFGIQSCKSKLSLSSGISLFIAWLFGLLL